MTFNDIEKDAFSKQFSQQCFLKLYASGILTLVTRNVNPLPHNTTL